MAITLPGGFNITNNEPVDARITVADQSARLGFSSANVFEGLVVYQQDTDELYVLNDASDPSDNNNWSQVGEGAGFPFTGSAQITGSLGVTGSIYVTDKVGVGTDSPIQTLHVNSSTTDAVAKFQSSDTKAFITIQDDGDQGFVGVQTDRLTLGTNTNFTSTDNVYIKNDGNVGIGTISPPSKLTVQGDISASGFFRGNGSDLTGITLNKVLNTGNTAEGLNILMGDGEGNTGGSISEVNSLSAVSITASFTGSLLGTATTASYIETAQTASYVETAQTASYVLNAISSSYAESASFSQTASYVNPLNQDVQITGSLEVTEGYISSATNITASGGNISLGASSAANIVGAGDITITPGRNLYLQHFPNHSVRIQSTEGDNIIEAAQGQVTITGNITASANISASGDLSIEGFPSVSASLATIPSPSAAPALLHLTSDREYNLLETGSVEWSEQVLATNTTANYFEWNAGDSGSRIYFKEDGYYEVTSMVTYYISPPQNASKTREQLKNRIRVDGTTYLSGSDRGSYARGGSNILGTASSTHFYSPFYINSASYIESIVDYDGGATGGEPGLPLYLDPKQSLFTVKKL